MRRRGMGDVPDHPVEMPEQHWLPVRRAFLSVQPTACHIGKFKADAAYSMPGQTLGDGVHEVRIHRRARAMGQNQYPRTVLGSGFEYLYGGLVRFQMPCLCL